VLEYIHATICRRSTNNSKMDWSNLNRVIIYSLRQIFAGVYLSLPVSIWIDDKRNPTMLYVVGIINVIVYQIIALTNLKTTGWLVCSNSSTGMAGDIHCLSGLKTLSIIICLSRSKRLICCQLALMIVCHVYCGCAMLHLDVEMKFTTRLEGSQNS